MSCELREVSEDEVRFSGAPPWDQSELEVGSDIVVSEGFSDTGVSRVTSTVADAARLYKYGFGGGSLREGAP